MNLKKGERVYYARIVPKLDIYEVCELIIRTVDDTWFVGIDKNDRHAYLLNISDLNKTVFYDRKHALEKVRSIESNCQRKEFTKYYEDY